MAYAIFSSRSGGDTLVVSRVMIGQLIEDLKYTSLIEFQPTRRTGGWSVLNLLQDITQQMFVFTRPL